MAISARNFKTGLVIILLFAEIDFMVPTAEIAHILSFLL